MKWCKALWVLIGILLTTQSFGASLQPPSFPSLISALKVLDQPVQFCGEPPPVKIPQVRERFEKELLLSLWNRAQVVLWLKRSQRYFPHVEKILHANGLPDDLKFVAVAESALRPHARSHKGATGFWQFMPHTGRKYGLLISSRIDQRRNLFAATRAAAQYFKDLHEMFGSWTLAAAAYNMGEEGLTAEIMEQGIKDYYRLYLPLETQRFVFRILSIKLILTDPKRFGFDLPATEYYPPLTFDQIKMDCDKEVPLRIIARAAKTDFKVIKDLNPEIRGHYLKQGEHQIRVPEGSAKGFPQRVQALIQSDHAQRGEYVYIVKKGDNLSLIADRFGVPLVALIIWNRLDITRSIHPGDRLIIYPQKEGKP